MVHTRDTPIMAGNNRCEMTQKNKQKPQTTRAVEMAANNVTLSESLLAAQDAVLQYMPVVTLRQLKAVNMAWLVPVRQELCLRLWIRLSRRKGKPEPAGVDNITDLDVECLKPWDIVTAGRQLPQLAWLHGYGFVANLQEVRQANLSAEEDNGNAPLGGNTLCKCIQGKGEPPAEFRFAAVACAASGTVRGIPVQKLRDNEIDRLDLTGKSICTTAALLAFMLPAATSVRSLTYSTDSNPKFAFVLAPVDTPHHRPHSSARSLVSNGLGSDGCAALAKGLKGNLTLITL